jgi:hypothetical protein
MRHSFSFAYVLSILASIACSSSSSSGGNAGNDAGPAEAGGGSDGGGADAGNCGAPAFIESTVTPVAVNGMPSAPAGGTIADGTYVSTADEIFGLDGGAAPTSTIDSNTIVQGSTLIMAGKGKNGFTASSGTFTTSGSTLTFNQTCPSSATSTFQYTATPTTLEIYSTVDGVTYVGTLTKQ